MGKDPFSIGEIPPTPVLVDQYFNDSTGVGDEGETDARGPWNEGGNWEIIEAPQLEQGVENLESSENDTSDGRGFDNASAAKSSKKVTSHKDVSKRKRAS
jgi:hypothetical protein